MYHQTISRLLTVALLLGAAFGPAAYAVPNKQADIPPQVHSWGSPQVDIGLVPDHVIYVPLVGSPTYGLAGGHPAFNASVDTASHTLSLTFGTGVTPGPVAMKLSTTHEDSTESFDFTVMVTNGAPVVTAPIPDVKIVEPDTDLNLPVSTAGHFFDPDWLPGSPEVVMLRVTSISDPGLLVWDGTPVSAGGNLGFTVIGNQNGSATVTVEAEDAIGATTTTTFNVDVSPLNDAPFLIPGRELPDVTVDEDSAVPSIDVLSRFDDPDLTEPADTLSIVVSNDNPGLVTVTQNGTGVDLVLQPHQFGTANIALGVRDLAGLQAADSFVLTVDSVNDPVLVAAGIADVFTAEVEADEVNVMPVTGVFSDADLGTDPGEIHTVTVTNISDPSLATWDGVPTDLNGSLTFTQLANQNGAATITVQAQDLAGSTVTISFTVNASATNDAPFLIPGSEFPDVTVDEDAVIPTLEVLARFDDLDLTEPTDTLSLVMNNSNPALVTLTPNGSGVDLTLAPNQFGSATIELGVEDLAGAQATDTFLLTVNSANDPVLVAAGLADRGMVEPDLDTPFAVDVTGAFSDDDVGTDPGETHTVTVTNISDASLLAWDNVAADLTGNLNFTLLANQNGSAVVTVQAEDGSGSLVTTDFTVTVTAVNDAPFLIPGSEFADLTVDEDTAIPTIDILSRFDDVDLTEPADTLSLVMNNSNSGLVTVTPNGSGVDLTLIPNQFGTATIELGVEDLAGVQATDTFLLNVTATNDPVQLGAAIEDLVVNEDIGTFSVNLVGALGPAFTDVDLDNEGDTHSVVVTSSNAALVAPTNSPVGSLSGTMTFAVPAQLNGSATITVDATDLAGTSASTSFEITVQPANDPPFLANPLADLAHAEDAGDLPVSLVNTFDDIDLANEGDVQNYSVVVDNLTLIPSTVIAGSSLTLSFGAHQNGAANVTVTVTDQAGQTASDTFLVTVDPVNDPPFVMSPIGVVNTFEDNPVDIVLDMYDVFYDMDMGTNGETLLFDLISNSNPGYFDIDSMAGSILTLSVAPDQFGVATLVVEARDPTGASATETFTVNISSVNDIPLAEDDFPAPIDEDSGPITIAVMANDYLAEEPTIIAVAGDDGASEGEVPTILNPFGDPVQLESGTVTISGNEIQYEPAENFFGTDYFTYVLEDVDGDRSPPARVEINVLPTNDAPIGPQERTFNMFENGTLVIDAISGALAGSYDVDGALLDGDGNPVGSFASAVLSAPLPPEEGALSWDNATGAFTYVPPLNFTGITTFGYRLFDGIDLSEGTDYLIRVVVSPTPPPPTLPEPGQVAVTFNVANVPLEQTSSVPPNVMVVMDTSGSMDWNMVVASGDEDGGFTLSNAARVKGNRSNMTSYVYLYDLPTNAYPANSASGYVLPTEQALDGGDTVGNEYGVWRARHHLGNTLYYNPQIQYQPWTGQDNNNVEFADADPAAIRLDPVDPTNSFDILTDHTYKSSGVPVWLNRRGTTAVDVTVYIPHYYTTDSTAPLPAVDPTAQLVEIRPGGTYGGGPGREDCAGDGDPMDCSYTEEIQNFANWFQYYRNREFVTKSSMGNVIAQVQDIRVGYETISAITRVPIRHMNDLYTEGDKKELLDNVYSVDSFGGTPLRQALKRAGETFECQRGECPRLPAPDGQCQQNFALLFTDGYWNGGAGVASNDDIDGPKNFDGGRYQDNVQATLADTAMFYYENDLHTDFDDEVPVSTADVNGAPPGTFASENATMHQHMKTWTIAFGVTGTFDTSMVPLDPTMPFAWPDPFDGPREKIDDLVHAAANGRGRYLNAQNPQDLQSALETAFLEFSQSASSSSAAAFNSTSLRSGTFLYRGFYDLRDNTGELTATLVNPTDGTLAATPSHWASKQLNPANLLPDNRTIVTSDPLTGDGIPFRHGNLGLSQQLMMSEAEVEFIRGDRTNEGVVFRERPVEDGLLGDIVSSSPVFVGPPRAINRDQAPYPENDLYSDFVQSRYSRREVVYVGANDGILHGFDASNLTEVFGYVPNKIIDTNQAYHNDLDDFPSPFYQHKYYVDLTPSLNDVYMRPNRNVTGKQWITTLLGGLGGGGKGFFALNVTDPDVQYTSEVNAADSVLWEFTDDDDTYPVDGAGNPIGGGTWLDPDGQPVKDLGMALSQPTIAMSNVSDGGAPAQKEWIAVFGNGINSTAGIAKLFVLFMDRGVDGWDSGDFVKLDTGVGVPIAPAALTGYPNGLGTVTAVDVDLNGTADWVYGGDRLGNLYRFDISNPDPALWTSTRLFTASYTDGSGTTTVQPVLSKPVVSKHPTKDGFLVTFGTGSHVAREDARSQDIQSIYTIWDRGEANPATAQPGSKQDRLVEQVITNVVDDSASPFVTRRIVTENPVNYVSESGTPGTYGWYVDFDMERASGTISGGANPDVSGQAPPLPQFPGEKAVRRMIFRDGNIIATTILPTGSGTSCFGARPGSILLFNALTGGNPNAPVVDFNNDGYVDDGDLVNVNGESFAGGILFDQDALDGSLVDPSILGGEGETDFLFLSGGNETISFRIRDVNDNRTGRLSWQELD
jgi:type IV pilus assembly protein PilY1